MIKDAEWMDEETTKEALNKLEKITYTVGASTDHMDDNLLAELTGKPNLKEDDFFGNLRELILDEKVVELNMVKYNSGPLNKLSAIFPTTAINAVYLPLKNWVEVTTAFLTKPVFDHHYTQAMNFGGVGFTLGHELTHGFDTQGRNFDAEGNLRDWWSKSATDAYNEKANCMLEQNNNFWFPQANQTLNGQLTLGETIADNGGVKAAFKAFKLYLKKTGDGQRLPGLQQYSPEQIYFINYARFFCDDYTKAGADAQLRDTHPPGKFRILGPLSNYPAFAEIWNCPAGSPYNPEKRCKVW